MLLLRDIVNIWTTTVAHLHGEVFARLIFTHSGQPVTRITECRVGDDRMQRAHMLLQIQSYPAKLTAIHYGGQL